MKRIIVPIDFSIYSENALKSAAYLAKKHNAEIIAVHMLELSNAIASQSESYAQQETIFYYKLAERKFSDFLNKEYLNSVKVTPVIKHFKIFSELDQLSREENADLIIMGSRGTSGLKEMFIGSNTEKVIRYANVPVLVIKEKPIETDLKTAVFACDFSDDDIKPYQEAKAFFSALGCDLKLTYVTTPTSNFKSTKEINDKVSKFINKTHEAIDSFNNIKIIADYSIEEGVLYYANTIDADVLVLATHGRKGIAHFFEGSISEDIANHSTLPVITFKI
ncbi:universal stress protein [Tenacibaculum sp. E3R01]|uniref:universal stress protein n=1 Tax=Tenacibaculum sp. E3R01 TaxID=2267227 RepID=UPI000DE8AB80|nr:universal stress protein [Tenacibaculum sp. E3R01]RBW58042.1 universal stress protein [Tenacibaculum sp. E3R01]